MGSWRPARPMRGGGLQPSSTRDRRALCATAACSLAARREGSVSEQHTGGPAELRGMAGRHAATSSSTELSSRVNHVQTRSINYVDEATDNRWRTMRP
ncbi:hypothetical protein PVAP13_2NG390803 [Panicum virgatum]|uniref:Uncharacterized protein n=1 Tax=Panicum virgatum TaxID=38727 RepID=A0A8T0VHV2_PANVG|nr:hypothetical protein PVAP13_2NG390803 [Panicum virgatum]